MYTLYLLVVATVLPHLGAAKTAFDAGAAG
jgi:hypothetical protein